MSVYIVGADQLARAWDECAPWLQRAIDEAQGDETLADVLIALARGLYLMWHCPGKYACVVQIQHYPRQKVAQVLYCGGADLADMKLAFEDGRAWCRANGIHVIRTWGRNGWARVLGLEQVGVILQERL